MAVDPLTGSRAVRHCNREEVGEGVVGEIRDFWKSAMFAAQAVVKGSLLVSHQSTVPVPYCIYPATNKELQQKQTRTVILSTAGC
jgi:hypothetical protein